MGQSCVFGQNWRFQNWTDFFSSKLRYRFILFLTKLSGAYEHTRVSVNRGSDESGSHEYRPNKISNNQLWRYYNKWFTDKNVLPQVFVSIPTSCKTCFQLNKLDFNIWKFRNSKQRYKSTLEPALEIVLRSI